MPRDFLELPAGRPHQDTHHSVCLTTISALPAVRRRRSTLPTLRRYGLLGPQPRRIEKAVARMGFRDLKSTRDVQLKAVRTRYSETCKLDQRGNTRCSLPLGMTPISRPKQVLAGRPIHLELGRSSNKPVKGDAETVSRRQQA